MKKLPVIETFVEALKFPYVSFLPLLRRTGVSLAILIGVSIAISFLVPAPDPLMATPEEMLSYGTLSGLLNLPLFVFGYAVLINGSVQVANNHPFGDKLFSLGSRELRFVLFFPLLLAILVALVALTYMLFFLFAGTGLEFVVIIGMVVVFYWITLRLFPLYGFIAIENKFAVRKAWAASKGNALRIFGVWLLFLLLCFVLLIPLAALAYTFLYSDIQVLLESGDAALDMQALSSELSRSSSILNLIFLPVWLYLFFANFGAIGLIYKHLAGGSVDEEDTAVEDQAA